MLDRRVLVACLLGAGCGSVLNVDDVGPGRCEGFEDGALDVGGEIRTFSIEKPGTWTVAHAWPLVLLWQGGNTTSTETAMRFGLARQVEDRGVIAIVPTLRDPSALPGWDDLSGDASPDLALYDLLRECAVARAHVDPERVSAAGFSGGAFFTYWLGMVRPGTLHSIAPFSGSLRPAWEPTTATFDALIGWGGTTDESIGASPTGALQIWSYETEARLQIDRLRAAGQSVIACNHGGGHRLPDDADDYTVPFLLGDLATLPAYCSRVP